MDVTQQRIINALGGTPHFDAANEAERRIDFLVKYLKSPARAAMFLASAVALLSLLPQHRQHRKDPENSECRNWLLVPVYR